LKDGRGVLGFNVKKMMWRPTRRGVRRGAPPSGSILNRVPPYMEKRQLKAW